MRIHWPRLKLRSKLVLAAGGFAVLMQGLLLLFMAHSIETEFEAVDRQRISATSSMLNAALAPVVFRRDYAGARDLLSEVLKGGAGNFDYVEITDNHGLPFAHSGVERPGKMPAAEEPGARGAVFHGTAPLTIGDQAVGAVRFGLSRRAQLAARDKLLVRGMALAALAGLAMIAAFMLIGYLLTRNLQRLVQATRAVTVGDYAANVRISSNDEIGDLAEHFNAMLNALRRNVAELKERSDRFRSLSTLSSDWFWEQDEHFRFKNPLDVGSNPDFHARSPVGKTRWELESSNLTPEQWAAHRAVLERHEPFTDFEFARTSQDGKLRWISTSGEPIFDESGRFSGYRGVGKDITERKMAETRLRATLDNTPGVAVQWFDRDGRVKYWNPASEKLYGITAEQAIGRTMRELLHTPEQYREFLELIRGVESTGHPVGPLEIGIRSISGVEATVMYTMFMLPGDAGNPLFVCMDVDITERKQSEQALRESEERFRMLFEQAPVGMTLRSVSGLRLAVNDALCRMLGYTFDELRSGEINIMHPDHVEQAAGNRRLMFEGRLDHYQYDTRCLRKDGTPVWVNFWATLIRDSARRPLMRLAVIQDISARKAAEDEIRKLNAELEVRVAERTAELAAANRELEAFAYSVSHDLKAPLRGIDGYSRLLLENYAGKLDDEGRRFLENVRKGAGSMHDLIEDLLAYARIERGGGAMDRLDLRPLVSALIGERLGAADAAHCRIINNLPDLQVRADREGLVMAVRNVLDNALKFTQDMPSAQIEVGARMEGSSCILWVRDNGPGFDMKYHDRIFGMFERLHRSNEFPGTGIGLAIVQKAMARMGGRVRAESSPGNGAVFYLEIPS